MKNSEVLKAVLKELSNESEKEYRLEARDNFNKTENKEELGYYNLELMENNNCIFSLNFQCADVTHGKEKEKPEYVDEALHNQMLKYIIASGITYLVEE